MNEQNQKEVGYETNPKEPLRTAAFAAAVSVPLTLALWQLVVAFGRANIFGFGGGPSVIP